MDVRKLELRNGVAMVGAGWVSFFIASLLWSPLALINVDEMVAEPRGALAMAVRVTLGVIGGSLAGLLFGYLLESRRRLVWCLALGRATLAPCSISGRASWRVSLRSQLFNLVNAGKVAPMTESPNPRLQRTPSAPLSRKPLGGRES